MDKASLRREALVRRDALPRNSEDAIRVAALFFETVKPESGQIVAAYWPRGSEVDTRPLIGRLLDSGVTVALPAMREGTRVLEFLHWDGKAPLVEGRHGIPRLVESETVVPDIVVVPLVAFDAAGHRLGYGGGYYDATLADLRGRKAVMAVGWAYSAQMLTDGFAPDPHDQKLDWVITPQAAYNFIDSTKHNS